MSDALEVMCTKCGAAAGDRCRTLTTGRVTDVHADRWEARYPPATAHACREFDPACWKCDLSRDEVTA